MTLVTDKTLEVRWKAREIDIDIHRVHFEIDVLQEELLNRYLQQDMNFRRAWVTDYSNYFMQFIRDKTRLNEPVSLSVMGHVRSGKSVSAITIAGLGMEARGKIMTAGKICASEYHFLEDLKKAEFGDWFVIDESKQAIFGIGSTARKMKVQDVQNIIAVNNISTIWIRPDGWSNEKSQYGLRAFGRGQYYTDGTKCPIRINRFMLYNLMESSSGGSLPLGMVYLPHFADVLKNGNQLWKEYSQKKQAWVDEEQKGHQDTTQQMMFGVAEKLWANAKFKSLSKKAERMSFITLMLGSEVTKGEIDQIYYLIKLLEKGITLEDIRNAGKIG